jgi:RNA polymerase sigma factor (sigma-70 family)
MADRRLSLALSAARRAAAPAADPDPDLLGRFAATGDGRAFEALVRRHGPLVMAACRRVLGDGPDAEDAFQTTFLTLARRPASVRDPAAVGAWLYGAAYRTALAARRAAGRRKAHEAKAAPPRPADPAWQAAWREVQAVLDDEVRRLPERLRTPFLLCCLGGHGRAEAAGLLGVPEGTLLSRLARAKAALRGRLARRGIELGSVLAAAALTERAGRAAVPEALVAVAAQAGVLARAAGLAAGRLRLLVALVLTAGLLVGGAAVLGHRAPQGSPTDPPDPVAPAAASAGDPLPPGALARMGTMRLRQSDAVQGVAFTTDGRELVTAGAGALRFWAPDSGRELRRAGGNVAGFALSPDGKLVAAAAGKNVVLFDVRTGREVRKLTGDADYRHPTPVAFAADGASVAAAAGDGSVRVYRPATGEAYAHLPAQPGGVRCLAFTEGQRLVTAGGSLKEPTVRVWDLPTERLAREFPLRAADSIRVMPLTLSPDGRTLAGEIASTARKPQGQGVVVFTEYRLGLWDVATGTERHRLGAEQEPLWAAAFSADGSAVAVNGMANHVIVWETATGRERTRLDGHPEGCRPDGLAQLAFSPDGGRLAAGGDGCTVHLWDLATGQEIGPAADAHHAAVGALAYSPEGRVLATGGDDHAVRLWDAATGRPLRVLRSLAKGPRALTFTPDGATLASADTDDVIRLWEVGTGRELRTIQAAPATEGVYGRAGPLAFTPDGRGLLSWGGDRRLCLWDVATGKELWRRAVGLSGNSLTPGRPAEFPEHGTGVHAVSFTPDGRLAALAVGSSVHVLEAATGRELVKVRGQVEGSPVHVDLSPDGRLLAVGGWERSLRLWEVVSGQELWHAEGIGYVQAVAFAPDGRTVAAAAGFADDAVIHLFDAGTGEALQRLEGHHSYVGCLAFAPDGRSLASGQRDTTALVWDIRPALQRRKPPAAGDPPALWEDLAGADARKALAAVQSLAATPGAVAFLKERMPPAERATPERVRQWVADLDSPRFPAREAAARELAARKPEAEAALREALRGSISAEARRRAEAILAGPVPVGVGSGESLRRLRAVAVLEAVGTPDALAVLEAVAGGAPSARETTEARAACERVARR